MKQLINVGTQPNSRDGDSLRTAFMKINANFDDIYSYLNIGDGGDIDVDNIISQIGNLLSSATGDQGVSLTFDPVTNIFSWNISDPLITLTGDVSGSGRIVNLGNTTISVTLPNSGVSSGTYGSATTVPVITVDAKGRVTNVSTAAIPQYQLPETGVVSGTYGSNGKIPVITVDSFGRITTVVETDITSFSLPDVIQAGTYGDFDHYPVITLDSKGRVVNVAEVAYEKYSPVPTGVAAGEYGSSTTVPRFVVNEYGQIVSVTEVTIPVYTPTPTGVTSGTYGSSTTVPQITVNEYGQIVSVTPVTIPDYSLVATGVAAGEYGSSTTVPRFVVNEYGQIVSVTEVAIPQYQLPEITQAGTYGSTTKIPVVTIDVHGRVTTVTEVAVPEYQLPSTGIIAGTYGSAGYNLVITVDETGRITSATEQALPVATYSSLGIASFDSENFGVVSGHVVSKPITIGGAELDLGGVYDSFAGLVNIDTESITSLIADLGDFKIRNATLSTKTLDVIELDPSLGIPGAGTVSVNGSMSVLGNISGSHINGIPASQLDYFVIDGGEY